MPLIPNINGYNFCFISEQNGDEKLPISIGRNPKTSFIKHEFKKDKGYSIKISIYNNNFVDNIERFEIVYYFEKGFKLKNVSFTYSDTDSSYQNDILSNNLEIFIKDNEIYFHTHSTEGIYKYGIPFDSDLIKRLKYNIIYEGKQYKNFYLIFSNFMYSKD